MNAKEAVAMAKAYIRDIFADEKISDLGLEEVEFDEQAQIWKVTVGFSRPWDSPVTGLALLAQKIAYPNRSYKIVRIDDSSGQVRSVKNREIKS